MANAVPAEVLGRFAEAEAGFFTFASEFEGSAESTNPSDGPTVTHEFSSTKAAASSAPSSMLYRNRHSLFHADVSRPGVHRISRRPAEWLLDRDRRSLFQHRSKASIRARDLGSSFRERSTVLDFLNAH